MKTPPATPPIDWRFAVSTPPMRPARPLEEPGHHPTPQEPPDADGPTATRPAQAAVHRPRRDHQNGCSALRGRPRSPECQMSNAAECRRARNQFALGLRRRAALSAQQVTRRRSPSRKNSHQLRQIPLNPDRSAPEDLEGNPVRTYMTTPTDPDFFYRVMHFSSSFLCN